MKTLSREEIQRMVGRSNSRRNVAGNNQESSSQGFATPSWVDENYLSKSFFSTLFIIHATQTVTVTDSQGQPVGEPTVTEITLTPNLLPGTTTESDKPSQGYTTTTVIAITSIEATKNFYSDGGVSALGQSSGGGGGGATALTDLVDVAISNPSNGQVLKYNSTTNKWENANESGGGGISMSDVWTALAASTNEQINASHLSDALNGYATQQWVGQQGFLTSSAISDMATQTWVGQQGFLTSSALNGYATQSWVGQQGFLTGITSSMVTSALGFTPLSNDTTFWGSSVNNGVVNGSITMQNGTGNGIYQKDVGGTARRVLSMDGGNPSGLYLGMDMLGYGTTFIRGNNISFAVGSSPGTDAMEITSAGRVYVKQGTQGLRIGDALLTWDATNKVLNLTNVTTGQVAHFVASGGVTALG